MDDGFGSAVAVSVPETAPPFDAFTRDGKTLLATRCFDDVCESGAQNGIWEIEPAGRVEARKLESLPYGWGAQPVPALGLYSARRQDVRL